MQLSHTEIEAIHQQVYIDSAFLDDLKAEINKVIVGQEAMVDGLLTGLLTKGHVLLEGLPGLAKTLAIKTLASAMNGSFSRIQFTPDLLPSDVVGTMVYHAQQHTFTVRKGPVFANFILADEINRAPAKVQSALLEAMQERQVTIGNESFRLEEPFLVLATQNPIEQEGTYNLPEAQLDRFMLKLQIYYPSREEDRDVMRRNLSGAGMPVTQPVINLETIHKARKTVAEIYMDQRIENYILDLVFASRNPEKAGLKDLTAMIAYGASPRASINLALASKARAFINRRGYVIPEDVKGVCHDVMRHRIGLTYEAEAENITQKDIVSAIINHIQVP